MDQKNQAVLGIGNALVDVINVLENDLLLVELGLQRGSMTLVDENLSNKIFKTTAHNEREMTTGGSAANTIHAIASLGMRCGYIGKTGNDILGANFKREFDLKNIETHILISKKETGRVMSLVSPDSERTMATYLGAAADMKPGDLTDDMFRGYTTLFIEGYLVQDHKLIETAIDLARTGSLKIALDLSSYNVVDAHLGFLKRLVKEKVDILFANEEEAWSFTGKQPRQALEVMASLCETAVVKTGKSGSLIQQGGQIVKVGSVPAKAIDTTGAGDNYAAGFLYGLSCGYSLEKCGRIAAMISGRVVEVMGAKIPEAFWPVLHKSIENMD